MTDEAFLGYLKQGYSIRIRYDKFMDAVVTQANRVIGNEVFHSETAIGMMGMELSGLSADDMISQLVRSAILKLEDKIREIKAQKSGERDA